MSLIKNKNAKEQPIHILKLTGLGAYQGKHSIGGLNYQVSLSENLVSIPVNEHLVFCHLRCVDKDLNFYFTPNTVSYFCHHILKIQSPNAPYEKEMFKHFYPIFISYFVDYLNGISHHQFQMMKMGVSYQEAYDLLFFQIEQKNQRFQLYLENKNLDFIKGILSDFQFETQESKGTPFHPEHLKLSLPVEVGVSYLDKENLDRIEVDDIVLLDKIVNMDSNDVRIYFNKDMSIKASVVAHDQLQIQTETKDW